MVENSAYWLEYNDEVRVPCHLTISNIKIPDVLMTQNRLKKKKSKQLYLKLMQAEKDQRVQH